MGIIMGYSMRVGQLGISMGSQGVDRETQWLPLSVPICKSPFRTPTKNPH
ncbi:hypothetical protein AH05_1 [Pseudomonas phage AH05]|uniref:Uncharacterized protein n=1 Tax=Pseudomonas phage AH05 TaxID=2869574 RepID=A0AAE7X2A1_9CAUD|nr:hypothetical protein AH05_1 [Pseudomonas phage AH05]